MKERHLLVHVTEKLVVAAQASGMVGSRENSVTRIHPSPLLLGSWCHCPTTCPLTVPRWLLRVTRAISLQAQSGEGGREHLFPQPSNNCPGLSSLVQFRCCAMYERVLTAKSMVMHLSLGPSHLCYCPDTQAVCHRSASYPLRRAEHIILRFNQYVIDNILLKYLIKLLNSTRDTHSLRPKGKDSSLDPHWLC